MPSSIIRRTCAFESKIWGFSGALDFVSRLLERDKKIFRKIGFFHFLLSFLVEKQDDFQQIRAKVKSHKFKEKRQKNKVEVWWFLGDSGG